MAIVAKFFRDQSIIDTPPAQVQGAPIPEGMSWMPKGYVRFGGIDFDCRQAGCYRFWDQSQKNIFTRLVYAEPNQVNPDLYGFMSGLSWHHSHGIEDQTMTGETLARAGATHAWRLKCGTVVDLARWFLSTKWGLQTRQINLSTNDTKWGTINGHIVVEVFDDWKWKLWDLSNGVIFKKDGVHLNAAEIIDAGVPNCQRIRIDAAQKRGNSVENGWCTRSMTDTYLAPDGGSSWFARMYQVASVAP